MIYHNFSINVPEYLTKKHGFLQTLVNAGPELISKKSNFHYFFGVKIQAAWEALQQLMIKNNFTDRPSLHAWGGTTDVHVWL